LAAELVRRADIFAEIEARVLTFLLVTLGRATPRVHPAARAELKSHGYQQALAQRSRDAQ
jgi:hypothetical protein